MAHADQAYRKLVTEVLAYGTRKENRTGVDTLSVFGYHYKIDMQYGFPILTTKEISWKNILLENLWFLSGERNLDFLHHYDVKFWDPWADENGDVPSGYGPEWRAFSGDSRVDQIRQVYHELKTNPMSRRMVVTAWNPTTAFTNKLPPCHMTWVLNVQKKQKENQLNLALLQRSCDIALGVPYNMAGYGFLLHLFAHLAEMKPGFFSHTLVDAHIYTASSTGENSEHDHVPNLRKQMARRDRMSPTLRISDDIKTLDDVFTLIRKRPPIDQLLEIFKLHRYDPEPAIAFKVAV